MLRLLATHTIGERQNKTIKVDIFRFFLFKILILKLRGGPTESSARSGEKQGTRCQEREEEVARIFSDICL